MAPFRTASDLAVIDQRLCEAPEARNYSIASLQTIDFLFLMLLTEVELHYFSLSFFPPASPSYSLPVTLCQTPPMPPTLKFIAFFSLIIFIMYIYVYTHVCTHTHVYIYICSRLTIQCWTTDVAAQPEERLIFLLPAVSSCL